MLDEWIESSVHTKLSYLQSVDFWEGYQDNSVRKEESFNKWYRENCIWLSKCKRKHLDPCLTQYSQINSKLVIDVNVRAKTTKLEENIDVNLCNSELGKPS